MPSQADFTNLDQLRLLDHGDAVERYYWPTFSKSLSEYENFWKNFIVLLTNRVDPLADTDWIMLRRGLSEEYESLLMANYSVFYHCVVAHAQIEIGRKAKAERGFNHPELFFFSAKACVDSLHALQAQTGKLLRDVGLRLRLPKSPDDVIRAITFYRDVLTHRGHLGRGSQHGRELIPKLKHLPKSKTDPHRLWSYTTSLDAQEMTNALDYQSELWDKLAEYLQGTWKGLTEGFVLYRLENNFINEVGLSAFLPIYAGIASKLVASLANPVATSGAIIFPEK
jgi:hypothetical protein